MRWRFSKFFFRKAGFFTFFWGSCLFDRGAYLGGDACIGFFSFIGGFSRKEMEGGIFLHLGVSTFVTDWRGQKFSSILLEEGYWRRIFHSLVVHSTREENFLFPKKTGKIRAMNAIDVIGCYLYRR